MSSLEDKRQRIAELEAELEHQIKELRYAELAQSVIRENALDDFFEEVIETVNDSETSVIVSENNDDIYSYDAEDVLPRNEQDPVTVWMYSAHEHQGRVECARKIDAMDPKSHDRECLVVTMVIPKSHHRIEQAMQKFIECTDNS